MALDSLEWKSDHVLLALESGEYEAGEDNLPVGFSLPAEAEDFFLAGYAEEFGPEVLPLMRYDIAAGDVNGDGARDYIVSALPQAMCFGNSPAPAYFFHSQPGGGYRMAYFSLAQPVYRFLDTGENGLPDLLFNASGRTLSYDGASAYEFSDGSPESRSYNLLSSKPEADGSALRVRSASITGSRKTATSRPISNRRPTGWRKPPSGSRCPTGPAPLPEAKASACGTAARTSGSGTARRSGRTNSSFRTKSSLFQPNKAAPFDGRTETLYNLGD